MLSDSSNKGLGTCMWISAFLYLFVALIPLAATKTVRTGPSPVRPNSTGLFGSDDTDSSRVI
jgi:hypothetical protein